MKKCIVIGGGFAGLSTAVHLANKNIKVDILESSPKLGGRAYSFLAKDGKTVIDNGQHIMMGCYRETLHFMKMIGAQDKLIYQPVLEINFLKEGFKQIKLKTASLPHPFNLLSGILNYQAIDFKDRLKILKFFLKIITYSDKELSRMSVEEWLKKEKQTETINKSLWEVIAVGSLNTSIRKASAKTFSDVLKEIFLKNKLSSRIILPKYGLSETYCNQAQHFLEMKESSVMLSHLVTGFKIKDKNIVEVQTDQGSITDFACVISTIPYYALQKLIPVSVLNKNPDLRYSSILTVHLWLKENTFTEEFYGLINSAVHWIFNKKTHLTLVISDADYLMEQTREEIFELIIRELNKFANMTRDMINDFQVIKEKRATFVPSDNILDSRPSVVTGLDNFFIAGDWVDTGLPSTIESAVKSGRLVSEALLNSKTCKFTFYNERKRNNIGKS